MFCSNEEVEMAVREWLRIQGPCFCRDGSFELVPRWDICMEVVLIDASGTAVEEVSYI